MPRFVKSDERSSQNVPEKSSMSAGKIGGSCEKGRKLESMRKKR